MDFNVNDYVNEDGSFVDGADIKSLAGDEHKETKCFDDIKDFQSFVKVHADTKSALGKKLDNVIQKPGENATDEEKAAFRQSMKTELGAVKSGSEYEFTRPDMPEGMFYDEQFESSMREMLAQAGVPKDEAKALYDGYNKMMIANYTKAAEDEGKREKAADEKLRADWPGTEMTVNTRLAHAAMQALGAEAFPELWSGFKDAEGKDVKGLEQRMKESGIFDSPGDLAKWRSIGVDPSMLRLYAVIGKRMQSGQVLTGEGTTTGGGSEIPEDIKAKINAENAGSPGFEVP